MNIMSHKGYTTRVEHDERDNIFVARILGNRSIIDFLCETVEELIAEYEYAVKDCHADCKKPGSSSREASLRQVAASRTPETQSRAFVAAQAAGMSLD
ncbi:MAG: toxin-antitoxin system HicB family antitoxin [Propionivibrio sp.]|uniref:toxin-antitoxin system HicB family antitoxin n=1 Tax=Propionivibrio sp. TaxID=2212460 RepID=UPI001A615CFE|nr:toxin-antitoxin system HicB family antitoxin [Propionivibrio sp.]MBL8414859.1 toxin-antitoxin system HicB family antitoxin [Propionivibrio sp.]